MTKTMNEIESITKKKEALVKQLERKGVMLPKRYSLGTLKNIKLGLKSHNIFWPNIQKMPNNVDVRFQNGNLIYMK